MITSITWAWTHRIKWDHHSGIVKYILCLAQNKRIFYFTLAKWIFHFGKFYSGDMNKVFTLRKASYIRYIAIISSSRASLGAVAWHMQLVVSVHHRCLTAAANTDRSTSKILWLISSVFPRSWEAYCQLFTIIDTLICVYFLKHHVYISQNGEGKIRNRARLTTQRRVKTYTMTRADTSLHLRRSEHTVDYDTSATTIMQQKEKDQII